MKRCLLAFAVFFILTLSACGAAAGQPERGQRLFRGEEPIAAGKLPACTECHADTPDGDSPLGPNLSNIGNRAGVTVPNQDAETYLRHSLLKPDEYLAGGFQEGIMNRDYPQALSEQDVRDLVAYMLTLKSGQN